MRALWRPNFFTSSFMHMTWAKEARHELWLAWKKLPKQTKWKTANISKSYFLNVFKKIILYRFKIHLLQSLKSLENASFCFIHSLSLSVSLVGLWLPYLPLHFSHIHPFSLWLTAMPLAWTLFFCSVCWWNSERIQQVMCMGVFVRSMPCCKVTSNSECFQFEIILCFGRQGKKNLIGWTFSWVSFTFFCLTHT